MLIEFVLDLAKMSLFVICAYAVLNAYARRRKPDWTAYLTQRRLAVLGILTLVVTAIKVIEDVVAQESGPVDEAILWFVRGHLPAALGPFTAAVTRSGSAAVLIPIAVAGSIALLIARRRFEAALLAGSTIAATLLVYVLKMIVGRSRPALWETQWYWGTSFPSGHTLGTAALSTAAALCLARLWPKFGNVAMAAAMLWTGLVALSRLALGVHWPSDVLAALCLGIFIPLAVSVAYDARRAAVT